MFGLLIAQESITSTTVKWFIAALLLVAALLTVLTVWYWRHTDPKRRVRRTQPRVVEAAPPTQAPTTESVEGAWFSTTSPAPGTSSSMASESAAPSPDRRAASTVPAAGDDDLEADDWLRLTGPQSLPRDSS